MNIMKKGQLVYTRAEVVTAYPFGNADINIGEWEVIHTPRNQNNNENTRCLCRREFKDSIPVIILGKTTIQTGVRAGGYSYDGEYDQPYLSSDVHHRVWVVVRYSETDQRYTTPFYILEEDINEKV